MNKNEKCSKCGGSPKLSIITDKDKGIITIKVQCDDCAQFIMNRLHKDFRTYKDTQEYLSKWVNTTVDDWDIHQRWLQQASILDSIQDKEVK